MKFLINCSRWKKLIKLVIKGVFQCFAINKFTKNPHFNQIDCGWKSVFNVHLKKVKRRHLPSWIYSRLCFKHVLQFLQQFLTRYTCRLENDPMTYLYCLPTFVCQIITHIVPICARYSPNLSKATEVYFWVTLNSPCNDWDVPKMYEKSRDRAQSRLLERATKC